MTSKSKYYPTMNYADLAEKAGFDLSLVDENLLISVEQRLIQHQAALDVALQLRGAYLEALNNGKPEQPATKAVRS